MVEFWIRELRPSKQNDWLSARRSLILLKLLHNYGPYGASTYWWKKFPSAHCAGHSGLKHKLGYGQIGKIDPNGTGCHFSPIIPRPMNFGIHVGMDLRYFSANSNRAQSPNFWGRFGRKTVIFYIQIEKNPLSWIPIVLKFPYVLAKR